MKLREANIFLNDENKGRKSSKKIWFIIFTMLALLGIITVFLFPLFLGFFLPVGVIGMLLTSCKWRKKLK